MKPILVAAAILFSSTSLTPQEVEHAPTVAQCQADQKLWLAELEDNRVRDVKFFTLADWKIEMRKCENVDPENRHKYETTESEALAAQASRQSDFIERHGLYHKFIAEDEAGKR
jgi:hypothetical protein